MDQIRRETHQSVRPTFSELFTPKLVTVLREGYALEHFGADAIAGLTVAIVALPLSMAIAIASGVTPERGLYTSIVGGFIVSALGGSRFQIGGPAGAFIVLVAATTARLGVDGLLLATMMAGVFLLVIGYLRLGTYIKFIPYPVTVGFTAGIAVIIFSGQIMELFGLKLAGTEPGPLVPKLMAVGEACRHDQPLSDLRGGADHRGHRLAEALAAEMAGDADRHRAGLGRRGVAFAAGGDDRHPLRRHPAQPANGRPSRR